MLKTTRHVTFTFVTDKIEFNKLERETYRLLYLGLLVAVCFHAALFAYFRHTNIFDYETKSIPVVLIIKPPRMGQPFRIQKESLSYRYRFRRRTIPGIPSKNVVTQPPSPFKIPRENLTIVSEEDYAAGNLYESWHDSLLALEKRYRIPKDSVPLKNEVLVDTGTHKSQVIVPLGDKTAIQGYTHLAIGCGKYLTPPDTLMYAEKNLSEAINYYTNIRTVCDWRIFLDDNPNDEYPPLSELFTYPLLYLSCDKPFSLTEGEIRNLAAYMRGGGFVILDNPLPGHGNGRVGSSMKKAMRKALGILNMTAYSENTPIGPVVKYRVADYIPDKSFQPLPDSHEIFHCFFDFEDGFPGEYRADSVTKSALEGMFLGGRLVGLYVVGNSLYRISQRDEEQRKMWINIIVYALKQGRGRYNRQTGRMLSYNKGAVRTW